MRHDIPIRPGSHQRLWPLLAIFVTITVVSLGLTFAAIAIQSSVRSYVAGEGFWSKGQRDAVILLERYGTTRDPTLIRQFQAAIAVPLGDRQAHLELEKTPYDRQVVVDGFLKGANHIDDIDGMITLYRCCSSLWMIRPAIDFWSQGDLLVDRLDQLGAALQREIASAAPSQPVIDALLAQVRLADDTVRPLADGFSRTMGDAAREVSRFLLVTTCGVISGLFVLGGLASAGILRGARLAERRFQQQLTLLAGQDPLTGLANRATFEQRCREAMARAEIDGGRPALLFIDLDGFKAVNDTYGHIEGDTLLRVIAGRIRSCVRNPDLIARVGGDEFTAWIEGTDSEDGASIVARKLLAQVVEPITVAGQTVRISASIGMANFPDHGRDYAALLSHADMAMYDAKRHGRNNFQTFRDEMAELSSSRLRLANGLRLAIDRQQLTVFYQPCVDLASQQIVSLEALLRWDHPEMGSVPPSVFIPLAEEIGMIDPISDWVLRRVCEQGVTWRQQGLRPPMIAVNMSQHNFWDPQLPQRIQGILESTGWPADHLCIEITETTITSHHAPELIMQRLKDIGLRLAIDDFGIGYSSLANLKLFPVDCLKIDRTFTKGIPENIEDLAFARTIIGLASSLQLLVIAEGIETAEQHEALLEAGCEQGQGYLFGRPIDAAATARLMSSEARGRLNQVVGRGEPAL